MNTVAQRNRELALRRELEALPRDELVRRCIEYRADAEEARNRKSKAVDDLLDVRSELAGLCAAFQHPWEPRPEDKERYPDEDGPCKACGLFPWHQIHEGQGS